jgi:hypothetical protein
VSLLGCRLTTLGMVEGGANIGSLAGAGAGANYGVNRSPQLHSFVNRTIGPHPHPTARGIRDFLNKGGNPLSPGRNFRWRLTGGIGGGLAGALGGSVLGGLASWLNTSSIPSHLRNPVSEDMLAHTGKTAADDSNNVICKSAGLFSMLGSAARGPRGGFSRLFGGAGGTAQRALPTAIPVAQAMPIPNAIPLARLPAVGSSASSVAPSATAASSFGRPASVVQATPLSPSASAAVPSPVRDAQLMRQALAAYRGLRQSGPIAPPPVPRGGGNPITVPPPAGLLSMLGRRCSLCRRSIPSRRSLRKTCAKAYSLVWPVNLTMSVVSVPY